MNEQKINNFGVASMFKRRRIAPLRNIGKISV